MSQLTEKDFLKIKYEIQSGRLSPDSVRFGLGVFTVVSGIMVIVAYMVANASNSVIGWENLSVFWQTIFKLQVVLFLFQLVLIFLVRGKSNWAQILLNISYVFYAYKMVLDPFITMSMFAKDRGEYETFAPIILLILIVGVIFHFYLISRSFKRKKEEKKNKKSGEKEKGGSSFSYAFIPILFLLVSITGYVIKNDLLGEYDILFGMGIFTILYIAVMIGAVEFVLAVYCVVRFPSFRVNPPSPNPSSPRKKIRTK